ncbi:Universal stress protein PHOS34 [Bienertia sinuspersici]
MASNQQNQNLTSEQQNQSYPVMPPIRVKPTTSNTSSSPRVTVSTPTATATGVAAETPTAGAARKIAIAVDLSDESAFAVKWAVDHYIRPGDAVVLLHVRPTSVLYGADWGCVDFSTSTNDAGNNNNGDKNVEESNQKLEDDFDAFTTSKASDLSQPLIQAQFGFVYCHIEGDVGTMASEFDAILVVRYPDEKDGNDGDDAMVVVAEADEKRTAEEEEEYHDASDERKG